MTDHAAADEAARQHQHIGATAQGGTFVRNQHPEAQWFPDAALGLFIHFGISAVHGGLDLSWSMMHSAGRRAKQGAAYGPFAVNGCIPPDDYWALAERFDPRRWQPRPFLAAARKAGFRYAVLTTRHHDGYALWPSASGELGVKTHLGGRDLVAEYVEACRAEGLKVGLYYSPPDWHVTRKHQSFAYGDAPALDTRHQPRPAITAADQAAAVAALCPHIRTQVEELLTRYGRIDLIWFDGAGHDAISVARIRELQPWVLINPRAHGQGDFDTSECGFPKARPDGWWEYCHLWQDGAWGYLEHETYKPAGWMIAELMRTRAWGGCFLPNIPPAADGSFPETAWRRLAQVEGWMAVHRVALLDAGPAPAGLAASVPLTAGVGRLFACIGVTAEGAVTVQGLDRPRAARLLRDGRLLATTWAGGVLSFVLPDEVRDPLGDVVELIV